MTQAGSPDPSIDLVCRRRLPSPIRLAELRAGILLAANVSIGSLYLSFRPNHPMALKMPVEEVAVGTEISLRPPHRSRRALLTHRAPTLDGDEEPLFGPRVQDAWERQVPVSDLFHSHPR